MSCIPVGVLRISITVIWNRNREICVIISQSFHDVYTYMTRKSTPFTVLPPHPHSLYPGNHLSALVIIENSLLSIISYIYGHRIWTVVGGLINFFIMLSRLICFSG
jgi:hypothetical protein